MVTSERITVLNPMGYPPQVTPRELAPRLDTLDGKTIYLIDPHFDDSDIFLQQVQAWFADHMPTVEVQYVRMSSVYTRDDPETWEMVKSNGDAAIIGVGH